MPRLIGNIESKGAVRAGEEEQEQPLHGLPLHSIWGRVSQSITLMGSHCYQHLFGHPSLPPLATPAIAFLRLLMCPFFPLGDTLVKRCTYTDYIPIIYTIYWRTYMVYGMVYSTLAV